MKRILFFVGLYVFAVASGSAEEVLDLSNAANMGFVDNVVGDRKGGWTDQGADNDMRNFPVGTRKFAGVGFSVLDPTKNGGRSVVVLRGGERQYFPDSAEVIPVNGKAKYLYLLHAIAWEPSMQQEIGTITCEYENAGYTERDEQVFSVKSGVDVANFWSPRTLPNGAVGWKGRNASAGVGIYVSRFKLAEKRIRRIRFASRGVAVWMIAGMTLSDSGSGLQNGDRSQVTIEADSDWIPAVRRTRVIPGSVFDFSDLLDAPAGKYGFLHCADGKFEFEKRPGVPVRFYGVNIADQVHFMTPEQTEQMVHRLMHSGYNLLRLHHFDKWLVKAPYHGDSPFEEERLKRFHYLIFRCREAGIYITLDLYTQRHPSAAVSELVDGGSLSSPEYKALFFLDEGVRNDFFAFSRRLLNSVSPYTKLALKDDPAVCMISFINEDTIFATVRRSGRVAALYQKRYEEWLKENRLKPGEKQAVTWRRFLSGVYRDGFAALRKFAKEQQLNIPLTDQNYWTDIGTSLMRGEYDYIDNHFYWAHPSFLGKNWKPPMRFESRSAISEFAGGVNEQFPCRQFGKPYSISEWNYCHPNRYNLEGSFLVGAYAALQDWDSLCHFTLTASPECFENGMAVGAFDIADDPVRTLSDIAGHLFFLRGDVSPAENNYVFLLNPEHWKHSKNVAGFPLFMRRLGLLGKTGFMIASPDRSAPELPAGTRLISGFGKEWKKLFPHVPYLNPGLNADDGLRKLIRDNRVAVFPNDLMQGRFRSDTGEIMLDCSRAAFQVSTPRSEGVVLEAGGTVENHFSEVKNRDTFAGFLVAAKDAGNLNESDRLLILHLTRVANSGETYRDSGMNILEKRGHAPLLLRRGRAELILHRDFSGFRLYAVDPNGKRLHEYPFHVTDGRTRILLNNDHRGVAVMAYELVKE